MKIWRVSGLKLDIEADERLLLQAVAQALSLPPTAVGEPVIVKKSLDARKKPQLYYVYSVEVALKKPPRRVRRGVQARPLAATEPPTARAEIADAKNLEAALGVRLSSGARAPEHICRELPEGSPVVVGCGPAGLFAALTLARAGLRPLVIERGRRLSQRLLDVREFWRSGRLLPHSNVQFGAGGAGTFSDGKLTFRGRDPLYREVIDTLIACGAPPGIASQNKAHIGSDVLVRVVEGLQARITELGGRILFEARLEQLLLENGRLAALRLADGRELETRAAILAIGHSARDTYRMLAACGVQMRPKALAIGLRIQHPQALIDRDQYGTAASQLPPADYRLTARHQASGRSVYSFCMCPGGYIVNAASEPGGLVTNGMSNAARDSGWANSALVVSVGPDDFGHEPLDGMIWQRRWEELAYQAGGGDFSLPCQLSEDFLAARPSTSLPEHFRPLAPGITPTDLRSCLPEPVSEALAAAISLWERRLPGFRRGVLAGIETRTSAPLVIERGPDCQSLSTPGLYPAGEGAGYAGGIISSAIDGIKVSTNLCGQ